MSRTTETLLKDAEVLAEHVRTRRMGYTDILSHHECEALISELSAKLRESEWQDISTAPKDGTEILITTESEVYLASWKYNNWLPVSQDNYYAEWDDFKEGVIIKWQPLPAPPKKEDR